MAAKIKVTRFGSDSPVESRAHRFLDERGYGLEEVRIQFVTSRIEEIIWRDDRRTDE